MIICLSHWAPLAAASRPARTRLVHHAPTDYFLFPDLLLLKNTITNILKLTTISHTIHSRVSKFFIVSSNIMNSRSRWLFSLQRMLCEYLKIYHKCTTNYLELVIWRSCRGRPCRPSSVFWTSERFWACRAIWGSGSSSRECTRSPAGRHVHPYRWPWSVSSDSSCCPRLRSVSRGTPHRW